MSFINKYIADKLYLRNGIYFTDHEKNSLSYPENGNDVCFDIEESSFWFNHRNNCIIRAVKKYCPDKLFFDLGGGNGFVSHGLINEGVNSVLVEPGLNGCLNAQKRKIPNIVNLTIEALKFRKDCLPTIGLFDVLEHLENDQEILYKAYNILEKSGYIFITVPAYKSIWSNEDIYAGHYRRYGLLELSLKMQRAGFKIEYSTYIFSLLPIPIFLFRTLPSRLGLNKRSSESCKTKKVHKQIDRLLGRAMNIIWRHELQCIQNGISIPFGGSCFIVASKAK